MTITSREPELSKALAAALLAARERPSDFVVWDALETQAADAQAPEPVTELYVEVLHGELSPASQKKLRERALRFSEEWFGDDAPQMQALLIKVFELEPHDDVLFERLVVSLTGAGNWERLLHVYDVALAGTDSLERRAELLDEAAKVAKDLGDDDARALALLQALLALRPRDAAVRAQVEKLLERTGRFHELVLSLGRNDEHGAPPSVEVETRIATLWLNELRSAPRALEIASRLLEADSSNDIALGLAESIFQSDAAPLRTRQAAVTLLSELYDKLDRPLDKTRVVRASTALYEGAEREQRHREAARLLRDREPAEALVELAEAFVRSPADDSLLRELEEHATRAGLESAYNDTLERAALRAETPLRRYQLTLRAAALRQRAGQGERAVELYRSVLSQDDARAAALEAGRALDAIFEAEGESRSRIAVLARLAELEGVPEVRRELLGSLARVALSLGEKDQALFAYRQRLEAHPRDQEALDGLVELYEERKEYEPLIATLRQRASTLGGRLAARDFGRIGQIYAEELLDLDKALAALDELHEASPELAGEMSIGELLERSARREVADTARLSTALGEAYRKWLSDAERALGHYARALSANPELESARAGLTLLLEDESVRTRAADVLASAYASSDDVPGLIGLLPHRLAGASGGAERARLLRQAAHLEATRHAAPEAAFAHASAALVEEPLDTVGDLDLWRLAEQLGAWKELVGALHRAADKVDPALPRFAQLRISEAELSELRLLDLPAAFDAYQSAYKALPGDPALAEAVCRVAALLNRYQEAFEVVLTLADRVDQAPAALLALLEERAAETGSYLPLAEAARAALAHARLNPPVRRELLLRVAEWYELRANDPASAEQVLIDAGKLGGPHSETLRRLAAIQRRTPSRALFDTLLVAADLHDRDVAQLVEAAELARSTLHDDKLERSVLERLVSRSASLLYTGQRSADGSSPEDVLVDATTRLADKLHAENEFQAELTLLRESAGAPIAKETARTFAERAAQLAQTTLKDSELAVSLYQNALELSPNDPGLLSALSAEYDRAGRLDDLVVLRRRELLATPSVGRRLELRLELSRVQGELEARGGRLAALRENLREVPGHKESIEAAEQILRQQGALADVFQLLSSEASLLEATGETYRAAWLWSRAASLADDELHDEERALTAYQKFAGLEHDERALESLARIRLGRGEPALAVPWLERSLDTRPANARVQVRLRLARAHQAAGQLPAAMRTLEAGVKEAPEAFELRDVLAEFYERNDRFEPLAELLADSAARSSDRDLLLAYARKAAALFTKQLASPARSVDVLARAVAVQPDDRALKIDYVDALIAAQQLEPAREVLETLINEYGRRRSPERAELHLRLSRVAKASGQIEEALSQLDNAASMDRAHPAILRSLGELAIEAGQLERAERAFRTLLLIVRKPQGGSEAEGGAAEVLYQLHRIALALGQRDKAAELLESAVQTAVDSEEETARLKALLLERGEPELLLRVLELRLSKVSSAATEAEVLSDLADVLEQTLDRKEDAFEARLKALASAPEIDALHVSALRLASALNQQKRYVDTVHALVERARKKDDATLLSDLALRAGSVSEHVLADLESAGNAYREVAVGAPGYVEAQFALARVAGKLGREDEERTVLERIALLPDEPGYGEGKRGALYRLIELRVQEAATRAEGLAKLSELVKAQPDYARASQILKVAYEREPKDKSTLTLLEEMARQSGDSAVLLDALERRASADDVALPLVREAVELALKLDEGARAEALLKRALELADARDEAGEAAWAPVLLARLLQKHGDVEGALTWLERAMLISEPAESFELGLELAALASESSEKRPADRARAIRAYEHLRERDPSDRRVWGPLLTFYKDEGELDRMLAVVRTTLESLDAQVDRNALRLTTARLMFDGEREDEGARLLQDVLAEDPDHAEAALKLADLYERRGDYDKLVDLLSRKLESARERRSPSVIPLSLRMGAMLAHSRPDQAAELYREALALMPENDELLRAAIEQTHPEKQGDDRAALIVRYLATNDADERPKAVEYARWLVEHRATELEPASYEEALELAHRVAPKDDALRAKLTTWHRERDNHARLAELLESEARRSDASEGASARSIALLIEAADLRLTKLGQAVEAAALLRKAREFAPSDFALLKRAVQASAASGELGPALAEVDAALESEQRPVAERIELYLLRAEIAGMAAAHDDAVVALTAAHQLGGEPLLDALIAGLSRAQAAARERGNLARERELTLRLSSLFQERGQLERAISVLELWMQHATNDVAALRVLLELTTSAKRWGDAMSIAEALCAQDEPDKLVPVAQRLVEASRALARPDLSRAGLERAVERAPAQPELLELLEELYVELGDKRALAGLLAARSEGERDPERRFEQLRKVGQLLVEAGDADAAMGYLQQALEVKPDDHPTVLAVTDAHIASGRIAEARELLERTIGALRQRRSPELGQLRHRMAMLLDAQDDQAGRYEWLNSALEADMNNGEVASELAVVAQDYGHLDVALKALRAITMMKGEAPMSRAEAFYRQAIIVAQKGEPRRAVLWAKKAKAEDQHFPGVDRLIAELESA